MPSSAYGRERLHHRSTGDRLRRKALTVNHPAVRYTPDPRRRLFAEEVRRTLVGMEQFGEDGLYRGGLSVRTTLSPRLQGFARRALIDGLVAFDRKQGWRGPVEKIDVAGDWGVPLGAIDMPGDIEPWRLGVVLQIAREKAVVGLRPQRRQDSSLVTDRLAAEVPYDEIKWATEAWQAPGAAMSCTSLTVAMSSKDPEHPQGAWSLMQIPEVGGGHVSCGPHTGRVLAIVGGFSCSPSPVRPCRTGTPPTRSAFKPFVYAAALDNGDSQPCDPRRPDHHRQGAGLDVGTAQLQRDSFGPTTLRAASSTRAT